MWPTGPNAQRRPATRTPAREVATATVTTDADGRAAWPVPAPRAPGDYRVRASAASDGRRSPTTATSGCPEPDERTEDDDGFDKYLELIAEKQTMQPGETARFADSRRRVRLAGARDQGGAERLLAPGRRAPGRNETIEVPITADDVGDTWVNIAFLKDDRLYRAERRARRAGCGRQSDRHDHRRVGGLEAAGRPAASPQGDRCGRRAGACAVSAWRHRRGGLRRQGRRHARPAAILLSPRATAASGRRSRASTPSSATRAHQQLHARPAHAGPFTLADFKADRPAQPQVRKDFPDAIYWVADLVTDAAGSATVKVKYPDALTTWRLTARAVDDRHARRLGRGAHD